MAANIFDTSPALPKIQRGVWLSHEKYNNKKRKFVQARTNVRLLLFAQFAQFASVRLFDTVRLLIPLVFTNVYSMVPYNYFSLYYYSIPESS